MNSTQQQQPRGDGSYELSLTVPFTAILVEEIGTVMGYGDTALPGPFGDNIARILSELEKNCEVRAGYRIVSVTNREHMADRLELADTVFTPGRILLSQLNGAQKVAIFVCTIGSSMEETAARLFREGDPVNGHFYDTVASVAVEKTATALHEVIELRMRSLGMRVTNRFSPGYCGWPLADQQQLFRFFPDSFCGITLTESSLMVPKKSISGIIGAGASVHKEPYFCDRCGNMECTYKNFLKTRNPDKGYHND